MKHYIFFILLSTIIHSSLSAQEKKVGLQGLKDNSGNDYYEWAGYGIQVEEIKNPSKEKDIQRLKKKYKIKDAKEYSEGSITRLAKIIIQ